MATKAEGIWGCVVLNGKAGDIDGITNVQINVQITDGPDKGQRCTYEDTVNMKSAKYVGWSCTAVGWRGGSLSTFERDVEAWIKKTGGTSTVEIRHVEVKKGKAFDKWVADGRIGPPPVWDKVNGIGRGAARPLAPLGADSLKDADEAMRSVVGTPPPDDDVPHAGAANDDIPFASCTTTDRTAIAKVLR